MSKVRFTYYIWYFYQFQPPRSVSVCYLILIVSSSHGSFALGDILNIENNLTTLHRSTDLTKMFVKLQNNYLRILTNSTVAQCKNQIVYWKIHNFGSRKCLFLPPAYHISILKTVSFCTLF